jgi:hypothetical protein
MRKLPLLVALAGLIAFPPHALALPEGNSGVDQYLENVPGAGGDRPSDGGGKGSGGGGSGGSSLPPGARSALDARGPIGAAVADLAEATAPSRNGGDGAAGGARSGQGQDDGVALTAESDEGSGLGNVLDTIFGGLGGGMGIVLPLILAAGLAAAVLVFLARRRRGGEQAPPA